MQWLTANSLISDCASFVLTTPDDASPVRPARCSVIYLTGLRVQRMQDVLDWRRMRCCGRAVMDRRLISIAVCAGLGAIIGVAIADLVHTSHLIGDILAGVGGGCGALVGALMARRRVA